MFFIYIFPILGETFYAQALQKAFALLKTNSTDVNDNLRKKVILFLTDGKPTDTINITAVLQQEKRSLKLATSKDVVIFAYGIGSHDFSLLRKLAEETEAEGTKVRIDIGLYREYPENDKSVSSWMIFLLIKSLLIGSIHGNYIQ